MRLIFRLVGTWLLGLALILAIIDGTKSLAANALVTTSLGETWGALHAPSLAATRDFVTSRFFSSVLEPIVAVLLATPAFLILAVPGIMLAVAGRSRRMRVFVRQDQI